LLSPMWSLWDGGEANLPVISTQVCSPLYLIEAQ
jgi:hypothetical protein